MKSHKFAILLYTALFGTFLTYAFLGYGAFRIVKLVQANFSSSVSIDPKALYNVAAVIDGDTFKVKVKDKIITVRMLGIDTPETVDPRKDPQCFGLEASNETKKILADQAVRLELNPDREATDKYGRYLAYVYLGGDMLLNEFLIKNGYAREYTYGKPYSLQRKFINAEREARNQNIGLWNECQI